MYVVHRTGRWSTSETWLLSNTLCNYCFFEEENEANEFATQCCIEAGEGNEVYAIHALIDIKYSKEFVRCMEALMNLYPDETLEERMMLYMTYKPNLGDLYNVDV